MASVNCKLVKLSCRCRPLTDRASAVAAFDDGEISSKAFSLFVTLLPKALLYRGHHDWAMETACVPHRGTRQVMIGRILYRQALGILEADKIELEETCQVLRSETAGTYYYSITYTACDWRHLVSKMIQNRPVNFLLPVQKGTGCPGPIQRNCQSRGAKCSGGGLQGEAHCALAVLQKVPAQSRLPPQSHQSRCCGSGRSARTSLRHCPILSPDPKSQQRECWPQQLFTAFINVLLFSKTFL